MAVAGPRVTVSTTATRLDSWGSTRVGAVLVRNRGAASVDLGGAEVTTGAGFELQAGESVTVDMTATDGGLYAVAAAGTVRCDTLQVSR